MNIFTRCKQAARKMIGFIRRIRITQTVVITWGMILLALSATAVLLWDTSLFLRSISMLEPETAIPSKQVSLTTQDLDDAINILDSRQQQFNSLIRGVAGTSTISF